MSNNAEHPPPTQARAARMDTFHDFLFLGSCLEGLLFGLYSGIFAMYVEYYVSKKETDAKQTLIFLALCILYVLSVIVIALDTAILGIILFHVDERMLHTLNIAQPIAFGFCDFITQLILIHRCWIVWGRNIRVVIVPSILACAFLAMWIYIGSGIKQTSIVGYALSLTSLTASITVNALVTGLIVFKIFEVFREAKNNITSDEKSLGVTPGKKFLSIIFIIIESGMALFTIQLARLVIIAHGTSTKAENDTFTIIVCIHEMVNGITPTIMQVRVSMGLSFHDETSEALAEDAGSSMQFDDPNPITSQPGTLRSIQGLDRDDGFDRDSDDIED